MTQNEFSSFQKKHDKGTDGSLFLSLSLRVNKHLHESPFRIDFEKKE
jgi:hypothetical protein